MSFHGCAAACELQITEPDGRRRPERREAHRRWTAMQWKCVLCSDQSRLPAQQSDGRVRQGWGGDVGRRMFFRVWVRIVSLQHMKTLRTMLCLQFCGNSWMKNLFMLHYDCGPVHQAGTTTTRIDESGVEDPD